MPVITLPEVVRSSNSLSTINEQYHAVHGFGLTVHEIRSLRKKKRAQRGLHVNQHTLMDATPRYISFSFSRTQFAFVFIGVRFPIRHLFFFFSLYFCPSSSVLEVFLRSPLAYLRDGRWAGNHGAGMKGVCRAPRSGRCRLAGSSFAGPHPDPLSSRGWSSSRAQAPVS